MSDATAKRCSDVALVEAMHDGRLGPRESASIERHLAACAACRAHLAFLRDVGASLREETEAPAPLAQQRARRELLRAAAAPRARAAGSRYRFGGLAFASLLVGGAAWAVLGSPGERDHVDVAPASAAPSSPAAPHASVAARELVARPAPPAAPPAASPAASSVASRPGTELAPDAEPAASLPPAPRAARSGAAPTSGGAAPATASAAPAAGPGVDPASRDFADAVAAVGRGDYGAGADRLRAFAAAHPDDPRADDSDYLVAVALQRANRLDEAAAAARRYLAAHPRGAHRPEAEALARTRPE